MVGGKAEMLSVIVADDEEIIRQGIATLVDWRALGMELIGVAENGGDAYRLLVERRPQVVITDIKMPEMDGLELIARAAGEGLAATFIVLSGYADFELARRAMRYGVRHYLLKPTDEHELSAVLREVAAEIRARPGSQTDREGQAKPEEGGEEGALPLHHAAAVVDRLTGYVESHLDHEGLSLHWIAENVVYFHPDYLGRLFKRVRGETFSQFLLRRRIQEAAGLLLETDIKVSEVAHRVGFGPNPQYFSQIFRHYTGLSPRDYREKAGNGLENG